MLPDMPVVISTVGNHSEQSKPDGIVATSKGHGADLKLSRIFVLYSVSHHGVC